jgi:hypothetical protein
MAAVAAAALAAIVIPACRSCSDERARPGAGGESAIETRRLDAVRVEALPGLATAVDLPAPRVRSFELLAEGKAPRQALRYTGAAGERALHITVRMDSREFAGETWTPWGTLPEIRYGLALRREAAQGGLEVRGLDIAVAEPAAAAPEVTEYVKRVAAELSRRYRDQVQGRRASATIDARGRIEVLEPVAGGQPPPGAHTRQEMLQILAESVVPLPEEPVGVGARWQVTMLMRRGAGMVNQVGTYELLDIAKDGTWRIRAALVQDGEHQTISAPELPAGFSAELLALVWRAEGEVTVAPASLTPSAGTLAVEYRVHSRIEGQAGRRDLLLESKGKIELSGEPSGEPAAGSAP